MAKKTKEEIEQIVLAYEELGTYSAVAKKLKVGTATVKKYVMESQQVTNSKKFIFDKKPVDIAAIDCSTFLLPLQDYELEEIKELWKEL